MQIHSSKRQIALVLFYLFIFCGLLFNIYRLVDSSFTVDQLTDFKTVYVYTKVWLSGENPFVKENIHNAWFIICKQEGITYALDSVMKFGGSQYPHNTLLLMAPFTFLTYKSAALVWMILTTYALFAFIRLAIQYFFPDLVSLKAYVFIFLVAFAFKGTVFTFLLGQPLYIAAFWGMLALRLQSKGKFWLSSFCLILCTIKITVFLPFFVMYVLQTNKKDIIPAVVCLGLFGVTIVCLFFDLVLLKSYLAALEELSTKIYDLKSEHLYLSVTLDLKAILVSINPSLSIMKFPILLGLFVWFLKVYKDIKSKKILLFSAIYLFLCLSMYHGYYDVFVVLPFLLFYFSARFDEIPVFFIPIFFCFIPVNGLVKMMGRELPLFLEPNMAWSALILLIVLFVYHHQVSVRKVTS